MVEGADSYRRLGHVDWGRLCVEWSAGQERGGLQMCQS